MSLHIVRISLLISSGALLASCAAPHPKSIKPMSISPEEYRGIDCDTIREEQLARWMRKEDLRIPLKHAAEDLPLLAGTHAHGRIESEYSENLGRLDAMEVAAYADRCELRTRDELKALYSLDGETRPSWPSKD